MGNNLMEQARRALRESRHEDAQAILINIIVREPEEDEAWVLLAEALADETKKRECLERARAINPRNPAILRALDRLCESQLTTHALNAEAAAPQPALASPRHATASVVTAAALSSHPAPSVPANGKSESPPPEAVEPSFETEFASLATLLEYGELFAQTVMMTTEPPDTRNIGLELLKILDQAAAQDAIQTRRWARTRGRSALVKYEKALTSSIVSLPRGDPSLHDLREQRAHALQFLK